MHLGHMMLLKQAKINPILKTLSEDSTRLQLFWFQFVELVFLIVYNWSRKEKNFKAQDWDVERPGFSS